MAVVKHVLKEHLTLSVASLTILNDAAKLHHSLLHMIHTASLQQTCCRQSVPQMWAYQAEGCTKPIQQVLPNCYWYFESLKLDFVCALHVAAYTSCCK